MRTLYDLAGEDPSLRFSPYCWRVKLALAIKDLTFATVPVRFTDKQTIAFSGQDKVPVLVDGDAVVPDSAAIAAYLDRAYPDAPPLGGEGTGAALTTFVRHWTERVLHVRLLPLIILDIHARLAPVDQAYFRETREPRLGATLEAFAGAVGSHLPAVRDALAPLRPTLAAQPFLAGQAPAWADCLVFGALQWARSVHPHAIVEPGDPIEAWHDRCRRLAAAR